VNGLHPEKGCTYTVLNEAAKTLEEKGINTEIFCFGTPALEAAGQSDPDGSATSGLFGFALFFKNEKLKQYIKIGDNMNKNDGEHTKRNLDLTESNCCWDPLEGGI